MQPIKRVAAMHDLSGYGRCSLSVVLPVLAAMGAAVSPLPTAYLSAHTGFPPSAHAVRQDMTGALAGTLEHWEELGVCFDAVYTGYLCSEEQAALAARLMDMQPGALVLVDPVLGDHGRIYRGITPGHCAAMGELAARAAVITPNLTECALLLGQPHDPQPDETVLRRYLERLSGEGRRSVVITGIRASAGRVGVCVLDGVDGSVRQFSAHETPMRFSGTGDLFTSVLLGGLLRGEGLHACAERAVAFVSDCAAYSAQSGADGREGILFEPLMPRLV